MKKFVIAVIAIILAAVGGYLGYRYWQGTPEYALSRVRASMKSNDIMLFREYVDLDTVLNRGIDNLLSTTPQDDEDWADALAQSLGQLLKPTLVSEAKGGIETWIETGQIPAPSFEGGAGEEVLAQDIQVGQIDRLEFVGIGEKRREGKVFHVTVNLHDTKYDFHLAAELLMRETPRGRLQVVEITNLADIFEELEAGKTAWEEEQNAPYRAKIEAAVQVAGATKSTWQDPWDFDKKFIISVTLRNTSDKTITRVEGDLVVATQTIPSASKEASVFSDLPMESGTEQTVVWELDTNQFIEDEFTVFETPEDELDIGFIIEAVTLEGGETLVLPYR